jgi:hypothetical protein
VGLIAETKRLHEAVDAAERLRRQTPDSAMLLSGINSVLRRFPNFQVKELIWVASDRPEWPGAGGVERVAGALERSGEIYQGVLLRGKVVSVTGYRQTLHEFSTLVQALRQLPQAKEVAVVESPWDLDPGHSLAGNLSRREASPGFALRLLSNRSNENS